MVTTNSGSARLTSARQLNSGAVNTGRPGRSARRASCSWPWRRRRRCRRPARRHRIARPPAPRRPGRPAASRSTSSGAVFARDERRRRPKRASTPASSAAAIAIGMRSITRSNQPVTPASVDQQRADDEGADRLAHADAAGCRRASTAPGRGPGDHHRLALATATAASERQAHAQAQRPHPRGDLRRRGAAAPARPGRRSPPNW